MKDQKIFRNANGRHFQIQATNRDSGEVEVLAKRLTKAQCLAWEPDRWLKKTHRYFRIAYHTTA